MTSIEAIKQFWEELSHEDHSAVCSMFASECRSAQEGLTYGTATLKEKRAVAIFLLHTGTLEIHIQEVHSKIHSQQIVFLQKNVKEEIPCQVEGNGFHKQEKDSCLQPEEHVAMDKVETTEGQTEDRPGVSDNSIHSNVAEDYNEEVRSSTEVSAGTDIVYAAGVAACLVRNVEKHIPSFSRSKQNKNDDAAIKCEGDDDGEQEDDPISKESNPKSDDNDDGEDDWTPEDGDKADKAVKIQNDGGDDLVQTSQAEIDKNVRKNYTCSNCAAMFHSSWEYDLHTLRCADMSNVKRSEYKCKMCKTTRRCVTKWGMFYHLLKHGLSGPDAIKKLPEFEVGRRRAKRKGEREGRQRLRKCLRNRQVVDGSLSSGGDEEEVLEKSQLSRDDDKKMEEGQAANTIGSAVTQIIKGISIGSKRKAGVQMTDGTNADSLTDAYFHVKDHERTCKVCGMECKSRYLLYTHMKVVHFQKNVKKFKCTSCGQEFSLRDKFKKHVTLHMEKATGKNYPCTECEKVCHSQGSLTNHRRIHSGEKQSYCCDQCNKEFKRKGALAQHRNHQHTKEKTFPCNQCDKVFFQRYRLRDHMKCHTGEKEWKCDECDRAFYLSQQLRLHKKTVHVSKFSFLCDHCGAGYKTRGSLSTHYKEKHCRIKKYFCTSCGKRFSRSTRLKEHAKVHSQDWPHQCQKCGQGFSFLYELQLHLTEHQGVKPLSCQVCGKRFLSQNKLNQHKRMVHLGQENLLCHRCGKSCVDNQSLSNHLCRDYSPSPKLKDSSFSMRGTDALVGTTIDHSLAVAEIAEKNSPNQRANGSLPGANFTHYCDQCAQGFYRKYDLKIHVNRHRGIEPLKCEICQKEFATASYLKSHKLIHKHVSSKFTREECGIKGSSHREHARHMAMEHSHGSRGLVEIVNSHQHTEEEIPLNFEDWIANAPDGYEGHQSDLSQGLMIEAENTDTALAILEMLTL